MLKILNLVSLLWFIDTSRKMKQKSPSEVLHCLWKLHLEPDLLSNFLSCIIEFCT